MCNRELNKNLCGHRLEGENVALENYQVELSHDLNIRRTLRIALF